MCRWADNVNSDITSRETTCPATVCYRSGTEHLILGIISLPLFLAIGIGSVYGAYWNVDGSFDRPKLAALVFGVFWSLWILFALWMIVAYFRERLFVGPNAITQQDCFRTKCINSSDATQVVWKRLPRGVFSFAGLLGFFWLEGLGTRWLIVAVFTALGGVWYVWRIVKFKRPT